MINQRSPMIWLLILQVIALILYSPAFLQQAPQAAVLPPALLILLAGALIAMNTGGLSLMAGRSSLVFVQGINIVVRLLMLLPNLKGPDEAWDVTLLITQLIGMGLSWYTMLRLEKLPLETLRLRSKSDTQS